MLNVDYKIATKCLATRLRKVLPLIISENQTCGAPDRSIFENLFLIRDTIDFAREKDLPLAVIALDQEKAFDRVNRNFLNRVLEKFNFGPSFRQWVKMIYEDTSSAIIFFFSRFSCLSRCSFFRCDPLVELFSGVF